jgi:glycosyltransferase involved in cell wall biosynthesis
MSNKPFVSVLMTSYNREQYIAQAIESVLASTYQNFELIIVDDCSNDQTVAIASSYALIDERVRVYINEKNLGDYPNRNKAASYSYGKYLKYVDADDYIYPYGLEQLIFYMEQFPDAGYGLCTMPPDKKNIYPIELSPLEAFRYNYFGAGLFHRAPLSSIIKREAFEAVGGFSHIRMAGDFDMWHKLSFKFPVIILPQGIIWYREHDTQEMNFYNEFKINYDRVFLNYFNSTDNPLSDNERLFVLRKKKRELFKKILKSIIKFDWQMSKDYYNLLKLIN